jgi:uncharacterized protein YndB with AHSA1/START domain
VGASSGLSREARNEDERMNADEPDTTSPGTEPRWVRMERRLDSSAERAFRAWTDPQELPRWLPERIEGGIAVAARTVLLWSGARVWWDVLEVHPSDTFSFRRPWGPDDALVTTVQITVQPVGYGSRVELVDGPFPIDAPGGLDAWAAAIETWAAALTMLRAHLDYSIDVRPRR